MIMFCFGFLCQYFEIVGFLVSFCFIYEEFQCDVLLKLRVFLFCNNYVEYYNNLFLVYLFNYVFDFKFQECSFYILVFKNIFLDLFCYIVGDVLCSFGSVYLLNCEVFFR